jgi:sarcosine oxidase
MAEAYPMWAELEAESGQKLIDECGLLYIGHRDAPRIRAVIEALRELEVPHQLLGAAGTADRLPGARLAADEVGIFTPEAGSVDAAAALAATQALALAAGTTVRQERADVERLEWEFDAYVVAAGGWIRELVPLDVRVTVQTFAYVGPPVAGPVWIDDESMTYGIPGDPLGHKIGAHLPGPEVNPDIHERQSVPDHLDQIREVARSRFGFAEPELQRITTCPYTTTPDEDFRLGRIGSKGFFASACSGHGFKMGPWVGRLLADMMEGKDVPENHPRFL